MPIFLFNSFRRRLLALGVLAGFVPLLTILVGMGVFAVRLQLDLRQSLADLQTRESKRLQDQHFALVQALVRQKTLDVAQEVSRFLRRHEKKSWADLKNLPEFRETALQPVGALGETFLVDAGTRAIILHSQKGRENLPVDRFFQFSSRIEGQKPEATEPRPAGAGGGKKPRESSGPDLLPGFLAPVPARLPGGLRLMVGAWVDPGEVEQLVAPSRAVFKTAMNLSGALLEVRLSQFRHHLVLFLLAIGLLGVGSALALAGKLTGEVAELSRAAEAYNAGDLDYRVPGPANDELGRLARTLHRMAAGLKENTVSRTEWENTFDAIPDLIMILDAQQRVLRLNLASCTVLALTPEQAVGRFCYELMHGADHPPFFCPFEECLREGVQCQVEVNLELGGRERALLVTANPLRDQTGKIVGAVHVARDITILKEAQKELAQTSHFLSQVITYAPLAVTAVNRHGRFTHVNPQCFIEYGYHPEDLLDQHFTVVYADPEEMRQILEDLRGQGEVLGRQVHLKHRQGRIVPSRVSIRKLWAEDGTLLGSVAISNNISEEIAYRDHLAQVQKLEAIATLGGGLAHNFNNLLMVIMGLTDLMRTKITPEHPFHGDLLEIEQQIRAGRELTRNLLTFSRRHTVERRPVDLNELVTTTADIFARTRREVVLLKDLAPDLPPVDADPGQIQQVLMNLLINAWQAMPHGGEIFIRTLWLPEVTGQDPAWDLKPGPHVAFCVQDQGEGMDGETVRHLFEPFFTTKEPGQGTGLGLATAYRIIRNHSGAIQVSSARGEGSSFTIFLPVSEDLPRCEPAATTPMVPGEGTVLVVDDEPILRQVAGRMLQKLGYRVLEADNGTNALKLMEERGREINLVLLDLVMPGLSGLQTLKRLKAMHPDLPILICSGCGEEGGDTPYQGVEFLPKPYPLEMLSQKLAAALRRSAFAGPKHP